MTTYFPLGSLMQHAGLLCQMRTMCNFLARAKSNSWPSLHLLDQHPKCPPSSICHLGIKTLSATWFDLHRHQLTLSGLGVIPFKLHLAPTYIHKISRHKNSMTNKQKRLINYVCYRLGCCRSIKLSCSIWSVGSLIRTLILCAGNCLCTCLRLYAAHLYSARSVRSAVMG